MLCANIAPAQRTALQVDTAASHIYAVTHRTGLLSFLGHEHVIAASRWSSELCFERGASGQSSVRFVVDARRLIIDADSARRMAGLGGGPSPKQRQQIQTKMLDRAHLNVVEHPEMRFESTGIRPQDASRLEVEGQLTLRGVTHVIEFPASLEQSDGRITFAAKVTVKQSAFGMKPESIAGVVKVSDNVDLFVRLVATETAASCP